ncbi:hypothetical protein SESBI_08681 [Sesbania bispinosa]|nr:hypothetical protein SESBI_08681 [Sesbania bispinosa]
MWWKQKGVAFKRGLRELRNDEDALELCNIAVSKKCEMEIYLEHGMSSEANVKTLKVHSLTDKTESEKVHVNEVINEDVGCEQLNDAGIDMVNDVVNPDVGCEQLNDTVVDKVNEVVNEDVGCEQLNDAGGDKVNDMANDMVNEDMGLGQLNDTGVDKAQHGSDAEDESDASEESIRDVHFDDSEEERALGADDGFNYGDVGQAEAELNEKLENMKKGVRGTNERGETSGVHRSGGNEGTAANVDTSAQDGDNAEATPIETQQSQQAHNSQQTKTKGKGTATETSQQAQRKGKGKATQSSQQAQRKGKGKATQTSQQEKRKGKGKASQSSQQAQSSQYTQSMRVTRSTQQSQQTKDQGVGPSNTKNIPKKRKADTTTKKGTSPTEMGGHAHKRQHHLQKLQEATLAQAEQLGVEQDPVDPTLPGATTTAQAPTELQPTLAEPSRANGEENDHQGHNVGDIKTSGEPSQTRGGTKG